MLPEFDYDPVLDSLELFEEGSYRDLFLLGFSQEEILARTGVDVGYHGCRVKKELSGIDRGQYRAKCVKERVGMDGVRRVLSEIERGNNSLDVIFPMLGIGNPKHFSLAEVFAPLGLSDVYDRAKRAGQSAVMKRGSLAKFGVKNVWELPEMQKRMAKTRKKRYGAEYTLQDGSTLQAQAREKAMETLQEQLLDPTFVADRSARIRETTRLRYGVDHISRDPAVLQKMHETRMRNHSYGKSKSEDRLYEMLVFLYGADDVKRQYKDADRYPYACDFYIVSRDLFIELNAHAVHGGKWYEEDDPVYALSKNVDYYTAEEMRRKDSSFYRHVVDVWTVRDVRKRESARRHNLNYVVFWDAHLRDAKVWFLLGMPDGTDWDVPYSWMQEEPLIAGLYTCV